MIPVFLVVKGGLGNQLFMYSYAFSYAKKSGRRLYLIDSWYRKQQRPDFLSDFERDFEIIKYPQIVESNILRSRMINELAYKALGISIRFPKLSTSLGVVNIDVPNTRKRFSLILYGYGHKPDFFTTYKSQLVEKFMLNKSNEAKARSHLNFFHKTGKQVVAVHIRRGDSVIAGNFSNVLPVSYYEECIDTLKSSETLFLIFSDDVNWCKSRFKGNRFYFVDEQDPILSLKMASMCDAYILSASSFSWWMAWISETQNPTVYFPLEENFRNTNLGKAFENRSWIGIKTIFEPHFS